MIMTPMPPLPLDEDGMADFKAFLNVNSGHDKEE